VSSLQDLLEAAIPVSSRTRQPQRFQPVPLTAHFSSFAHCKSASEYNEVARLFVDTTSIDDAVAYASTQIAIGLGIPPDLPTQHLLLARQNGLLGAIRTLQENISHRTLRPKQPNVPVMNPPLLPIRPYPLDLQNLSGPTLTTADTNLSDRLLVPAAASRFLDFTADPSNLSIVDKRTFIAQNGVPLRLPTDFVPNNGIGIVPYPPTISPPSVIEVHIAKLLAAGKGLILPLNDARILCAEADLLFNVSNTFLQEKLNSVLMRLIVDYTGKYSTSGGINTPSKSDDLPPTWTPIRNPTAADVCQILENAKQVFPGQPLHGIRVDIDDAYPRLKLDPKYAAICSVYLVLHGKPYVFIPFIAMFGLQDINFAFHLITEAVGSLSQFRDISTYGCQLSTGYTDDFLSFRPPSLVPLFVSELTRDIHDIIASDCVNDKKTLTGLRTPMIGFDTDTTASSIGVLEKHFGTVWHFLFGVIPIEVSTVTVVSVEIIQTLSSHMIRLSNLIPPLLSFSRGLANNLAGLHRASTSVKLSARSVSDIWMWRAVLHHTLSDARWLTVPTSQPLLFRRLCGEGDEARALRQSAAADYKLFADACTSHGQGIGCYLPSIGWLSSNLPTLLVHFSKGQPRAVDINVLEFIASILALISFTQYCNTNLVPMHNVHVHIWTDNTSCKSWLTTHRADHPLHSFLLQIFGLLQTRYGLIVTVGHIKGQNNIYADAISRNFDCPNAEQSRLHVMTLPQFQASQVFISSVLSVARLPSEDTFALTVRALTVLEQLTS
jgi:hypothetical protein